MVIDWLINEFDSFIHRLTSSSIGSDEDFNMMANGDASSQDSGQHFASVNRPAMNQFRKQKVNAEIEGIGT